MVNSRIDCFFCHTDVAVEFFKQDGDCDLSDYGEEKTYQVDDEPEPELYESASHEEGKCKIIKFIFFVDVHSYILYSLVHFCTRRR